MKKIVFLDALTLGGVSLAPIEELGELKTYEMTDEAQVVERLQGADVVITNKVKITSEVIEKCVGLKLICVAATGTNCVDLAAAENVGVPVKNVAGYSTASVCQHTIGMLINLANNMHRFAGEPEKWAESPMFTRLDFPMLDLAGKTLGIAGLGEIGRAVAVAASALGMDVIALAREISQAGEVVLLDNDVKVKRVSEREFYSTSDAITLHCPLTPETEGMIHAGTLAEMKPSAFLINTGRGDLIVEQDLADALRNRAIAGAGLDVLTAEPPAKDHVLLDKTVPNLMITPHTAWASIESREKLVLGVAKNIQDAHFS